MSSGRRRAAFLFTGLALITPLGVTTAQAGVGASATTTSSSPRPGTTGLGNAGPGDLGLASARLANPAPADPSVEREPTQAEIDAQAATVEALRQQAEADAGDVQDARRATRAAAVIAGQALEAYTGAQRALQEAQETEDQLDDELRSATAAAQEAGRRVGRWARQAYQGGSGLNASPLLNALLGTDGGDALAFGSTVHTLRRIGDDRSRDLEEGRRTRARAEQAAADAAVATEKAVSAARVADEARSAADAAVARQRRILDDAEASLDISSGQVRSAEQKEQQLRAALQSSPGPSSGSNSVTGPTGSCTGSSDLSAYPNGQIPRVALCALNSAPGHYLRADAAYAFDRLSAAYAARFGSPICVTDSYRDYDTQVRLYATKPNLAARPGTSNHGWGTATDLCGGVQTFGSAQHEWLFSNAPQYGWFHPAWAQRTGSRPEAWHWEFGG
ncbi:M15 family metallopeptidase [Kineosporia succinea]|uniref:D-alanyl-D-alanine carboxypeptidase-like core domain-containing protein n=1 Tax=Kineosporia succinea TaxID=84632 RepID=A0ABT9P7V9_9ACTN|nr:M15 family metallopeptidase [Kineosporia succinea]MDP9828787.1 hypothetical protein [Kineosporia succinea]